MLFRSVLPLLEEVHSGSTAHLAETAALLAADSDFLEQAAKAAYEETKPVSYTHLCQAG